MAELIVFPDATDIVVDTLADTLATIAPTAVVRTRVPDTRPELFVLVRRTGGTRRNLVIDDAQVSIEAWGPSEQLAHDLAQQCRAIVHRMEHTGEAWRVEEFAGPQLLPDPESDQPRYVATYVVSLRGTATDGGAIRPAALGPLVTVHQQTIATV